MRRPGAPWFLAAALSAATPLSAAATTITLPAAASIQGLSPFYSDVRAFNTSYADALQVTATYRCFLGPCPSVPPQIVFEIAPRDSTAFDDMVNATFGAANTAGGVEFDFDAAAEQLVVTSRLYSTSPTPTVGMYIPGVDLSQAYSSGVLTSVRNGGDGAGFRTNVGLFNPGIASVSVAFRILVGGVEQGGDVSRVVGPHAGTQVNAIFTAAGVGDLQSANAVVTVQASGPVFAYAAVIDNETSDPYYVSAALDRASSPTPTGTAGTPTASPTATATLTATPTVTGTPPTATPTGTATLTPTPTPTPSQTPAFLSPTFTPSPPLTPPNTPTQTPNPNHIVLVGTGLNGQGSGTNFWDAASGSSNTTIYVGQTVEWQWVAGMQHTVTSGSCPNNFCSPDGVFPSSTFEQAPFIWPVLFTQVGTYPYYCMAHGSIMTGAINVIPQQ
jgi:hypothetical protein